MTVFMRHIARAAGLTAADKRAAESVLGRGHRLTRAVANQHTTAQQSLVAGLAVAGGGTGLPLHLGLARLFVEAAVVVGIAFVFVWAVTHRIVRERAQELIADGGDGVVLSVIARERRRLGSVRVREQLARSLESLHQDALRWHQILPQFRPLHGVQQLGELGVEVAGLTAALRRERTRVQGVALTERLLSDGSGSPLYANELEPLREELNRIRYLLEATDEPVSESATERRAA
jgi:hypothetical protein